MLAAPRWRLLEAGLGERAAQDRYRGGSCGSRAERDEQLESAARGSEEIEERVRVVDGEIEERLRAAGQREQAALLGAQRVVDELSAAERRHFELDTRLVDVADRERVLDA